MRTLRQVEEDFRLLDDREGRVNQYYEKNKFMKNSRQVSFVAGMKRYPTNSYVAMQGDIF